ncbi:aldo/keto reductase [Lyngbya sp. PCC 8106]|uniref:aldo/keto reductase n=1 Tax=Lyngbya sp. (strain PCC 8106) TaxID=313612 RepID=UPI000587B836|nr:aldo/keto reductase [Lyngbya sp. PCC 8106]
MRYRRFGKTNLRLSVLTLGTMRYLASAENARQTVQQAVSQGINHIETARGYGNSERYLGAALLAGLPIARSQLYITSKLTPSADPSQMERWVDECLDRLNLDYLDCLALHGINSGEHLDQAIRGMSGVQKTLEDGRVRHVGFSTHAPLEVILAAINTHLFEFVNLHYYYFFQRNAAAIELANQNDMGIFIISPADKGGQLYTPSPDLERLCQPFSPLMLNYRFLLSDRRITTLSVGAANPDELDGPLTVANQDGELTQEEKRVLDRLEATQRSVLGSERCSQCYQCLPCPEAINIPEVLRLRNLAVAYGMTEFGQYRYRMFENAGHWFPGSKGNRCTDCGDCLPRCPEKLEIPMLLRDTHQRLKGKEGRRLWE